MRIRTEYTAVFFLSYFISVTSFGSCLESALSLVWGKKADSSISQLNVIRTALSRDAEKLKLFKKLKGQERKEAELDYAYRGPTLGSWQNVAVGVLDWAMTAPVFYRIAEIASQDPYVLIPALTSLIPAHYAAGFGSALYHKHIDSWKDSESPVAIEFRHHHEFPENLNGLSYWDNLASGAKPMVLPFAGLAVLATLAGASPDHFSNALQATGLTFSLGFWLSELHTTEFHRQAHLKNPHWLAKLAQDAGLILNRTNHNGHHKKGFDNNYDVNSGWSDPLTERLDLWDRLDMLRWKVLKRMPHNWIQDPSNIPESVIQELEANPSLIPTDLWEYSELHPSWVPPRLKPLLAKAKSDALKDFQDRRRKLYLDMAKIDREVAEKEWADEQSDLARVYGTSPEALFPGQD